MLAHRAPLEVEGAYDTLGYTWQGARLDLYVYRDRRCNQAVYRKRGRSAYKTDPRELNQHFVQDGLETAAGPIATQMVVDASGATRWLGRALGVSSPARSPRLIARATATGKDRVQPMMTRLLWSETSPDGPGAPEPLSMDAVFRSTAPRARTGPRRTLKP